MKMIDRRFFLAAGAAFAVGACTRAGAPDPGADAGADAARFEAIRATLGPGARLGVAAIDTASGRELHFDSDSRYAMASTFKLPLAAAVLALAEQGRLTLDEELPFDPGEPLPHSPSIVANLERGRLPIVQLCAAIVERSDNGAANLLLRRIGGPEALTRFVRAQDDPVTRLDRYETELNSNLAGDPRDSTSPRAMAGLVRNLVVEDSLAEQSRRHLSTWLTKAVPGQDRLKAGFPAPPWLVGNKTGTGANGAVNDVAVAWRSGKAPVVVASYQSAGTADLPARAAAHAAVGRLVAERFG
jgi:beta-lactamase class A